MLAGARGGAELHLWKMREGKSQGSLVKVPGQKFNGEPMFATDGKKVLVVWTTFMVGGGRSSGMLNSGTLLIDPGAPLASQKIKGKDYTADSKCLATTGVLYDNRKQVRHPWPAWDGKTYVVAWDIELSGKDRRRHDAVFLRRVSAAGEPLDKNTPVAGEFASPAFRPTVASDGAGTTLVAYERHPKTGDVPIKIAFRMLKGK